ncbi:MAG TPA: zinc ribbon domain-containing protein [Polyangiaceae bacterium]|nr:zinc ribbon domain-containing protein [Polyangiaceae bacterium]
MAELVYEMLWDCRYCGTRKLLGLTHRHCPGCGAPQDPNARYFPDDSEKVAVQNHEFVGADIACRYCGCASSKRAHHCGRCGAPLAEGSAVISQTSPGLVQPLVGSSAPQPPARPAWKLWVPALALVLVSVTAVAVLWKKDRTFVVAQRSWQRSVSVERFGAVRETAWCSELPAGAREMTRHREQHGTHQVPDGEDCRTQKKDRGDGTFKEEQVCTPKHKDEPVYEDKCSYELVKWTQQRQEKAEGDQATAPRWPAVTLARSGCSDIGCEREGTRSERYSVTFRDDTGESYHCDFPETTWEKLGQGKRYPGKLRALVGTLDCGSLTPAR